MPRLIATTIASPKREREKAYFSNLFAQKKFQI